LQGYLFAPSQWKGTVALLLVWLVNAFAYYGIVLMTTEVCV
jgi:hypothetical protein